MRIKLAIIAVFLFAACPLNGQAQQKRVPSEKDFGLWSTMYNEQISDSGTWVSYRKDYEQREDSLFAKHTNSNKTFGFAGGADGQFLGDSYFACLLPQQRFEIVDLKTGKRQVFNGVDTYHLLSKGNLIVLSGEVSGKAYMEIRAADGKLIKRVENITVLKVNRSGNQVLYAYQDQGGSTVCVYGSDQRERRVAHSELPTQQYVNASWNGAGNAVAFLIQEADGNISGGYLYHSQNALLYNLDPKTIDGFPESMQLKEGYNPIAVSDDGERVFLRFRSQVTPVKEPEAAQVWNGNDTYIYPTLQQITMMQGTGDVGVWHVLQKKFVAITDGKRPKIVFNGNHRFALIYNPLAVTEPQNYYDEPTDFYLVDIVKGTTRLWLANHSSSPTLTTASPSGAYFAYMKGSHWYLYHIKTDVHISLSALLPDMPPRDAGGEPELHDVIGFSREDRSVFVADGTDIWEIDLSNLVPHRITDGIKTKINYQVDQQLKYYDGTLFDGVISNALDAENGFYLFGRDQNFGRSGYFKWSKLAGLQKLTFTEGFGDQLRVSKAGKFVYHLQTYEQPPTLLTAALDKKDKIVVKSNPHHAKFLWGNEQMVHYKNKSGQDLSGVLYYPAGYVKGRQYPMIVSIYELQSDQYHQYTNPSVYNPNGFNVTNYTSQGYLVLKPDIVYEPGNPGPSALDCVTAAVSAVAAMGVVRTESIGLIGHSFGGYETNFIITQTGLFAAAVAGAGISDTPRMYLSYGTDTARPDLWRFEHQQFRMGKSLFEDPERYCRNSPMAFVQQVQTPLLSWTGAQDHTVPPEQSIGFYIALRRLGKKQVMLVFPEEAHNIINPENQSDLTKREMEWFGYYLKGEESTWVIEGTK